MYVCMYVCTVYMCIYLYLEILGRRDSGEGERERDRQIVHVCEREITTGFLLESSV